MARRKRRTVALGQEEEGTEPDATAEDEDSSRPLLDSHTKSRSHTDDSKDSGTPDALSERASPSQEHGQGKQQQPSSLSNSSSTTCGEVLGTGKSTQQSRGCANDVDEKSGTDTVAEGMDDNFATDPVITPNADFEDLLNRRDGWGYYEDWRVEALFLGYLTHWSFRWGTVIPLLMAFIWIGWLVSYGAGDVKGSGPLAVIGAVFGTVMLLVYALANFLFIIRPAQARGKWKLREQFRFLRRCEKFASWLLSLSSLYNCVGIYVEIRCRERGLATATHCDHSTHFVYMSQFVLGMAFFRGRSRAAVSQYVLPVMFVAVRHLVIRNTPMFSAVREVVFSGSCFLTFGVVLYALWRLGFVKREQFEARLRRKRMAKLVAYHQQRTLDTLWTVLPSRNLEKFLAGQPAIDERSQCIILVTRIFDFARWASSMLPPTAVNLPDMLFSHFDRAARRFHCEKVQQTDELYIVSAGLREGVHRLPAKPHEVLMFGLFQHHFCKKLKFPDLAPDALNLKIASGVASGKATGAYLQGGHLLYHVYGEAMTTATALSRSAEAHQLLVTEELYRGLPDKRKESVLPRIQLLDKDEIHTGDGSRTGKKIRYVALPRRRTDEAAGSFSSFTHVDAMENGRQRQTGTAVSSANLLSTDGSEGGGGGEDTVLTEDARMDFLRQQGARFEMHRRELESSGASTSFEGRLSRTGSSDLGTGSGAIAQSVMSLEVNDITHKKMHNSSGNPNASATTNSGSVIGDSVAKVERHTRLSVEGWGIWDTVRPRFQQADVEESYWLYLEEDNVPACEQGNMFYFLLCALVGLDFWLEDISESSPLSVGVFGFACIIVLTRWFLKLSRQKLERGTDFAAQIGALTSLSIAVHLSGCAFHVRALTLEVSLSSLALVLGGFRLPWYHAAYGLVMILSLAGGLAFVPRLALWEQIRNPIIVATMNAWLAWDREMSRRRVFVDEYILVALRQDLEQQLLWHRGLLSMLVPDFIVDQVVEKPHGGKCITLFLDRCVIMDLRFSALPVPSASRGGEENVDLGALYQRRFQLVEAALVSLRNQGLLAVLHVVGDSMRAAGPMLRPSCPEGPQLANSAHEMKRFTMRAIAGGHTKDCSNTNSARTATTLLVLLGSLLEGGEEGMTACIVEETAFASVVGNTQPQFEIGGVAPRVASAMMEAAPNGFLGITEKLSELMNEANPMDEDDTTSLLMVKMPAERWRLRGVGFINVLQLESF